MIKRIVLAGPNADDADRFSARWRARSNAADAAPHECRPRRVTLCAAVDEVTPDQRHRAVGLEWFDDDAHLIRFDSWFATRGPSDRSVDATVVVAAEHVMRGDDWLEQRWTATVTTFKHIAIARRAAGLTPAEHSERWRTGAGRIQRGGEQPALVIPDDVRGCAYVQNHPVPRTDGEWEYDAVNEVSFDDLAGLRTRAEWFAEHVGAGAEPDLISANWFLATSEAVLLPGR
jgi:hypothetical protein